MTNRIIQGPRFSSWDRSPEPSKPHYAAWVLAWCMAMGLLLLGAAAVWQQVRHYTGG